MSCVGLPRGLPRFLIPLGLAAPVCVVIQPGSGPLRWSTFAVLPWTALAPRLVPESRLDKAPGAALTGGFHWALWACGTAAPLALPATVALLRRKAAPAGLGRAVPLLERTWVGHQPLAGVPARSGRSVAAFSSAAMDSGPGEDQTDMNTNPSGPRPVVHLELHTGDQSRATAFYARLLRWRPE